MLFIRFIGKHVVDFLLVLTELFFLGITAEASEYRLKIGVFGRTGSGLAQNFRYKGRPHQPLFLSENYRRMCLLYGIRISAEIAFFFHNSAVL